MSINSSSTHAILYLCESRIFTFLKNHTLTLLMPTGFPATGLIRRKEMPQFPLVDQQQFPEILTVVLSGNTLRILNATLSGCFMRTQNGRGENLYYGCCQLLCQVLYVYYLHPQRIFEVGVTYCPNLAGEERKYLRKYSNTHLQIKSSSGKFQQ